MTSDLLNYLLTLVLVYGYPIIAVCVLAGEFYLPVPSATILLAAGSFSSDGSLNIFIIIAIATVVATCGDIFGYHIGKRYGMSALGKLKISPDKLHSTENILDKWGRWFIFVTRWLITPLGVPLNLVAGINKYSFRKFLIWAFLGELLWASMYTYLGYLFGANWASLVDVLGNISRVVLFAIIGFGVLYAAAKLRQKYK